MDTSTPVLNGRTLSKPSEELAPSRTLSGKRPDLAAFTESSYNTGLREWLNKFDGRTVQFLDQRKSDETFSRQLSDGVSAAVSGAGGLEFEHRSLSAWNFTKPYSFTPNGQNLVASTSIPSPGQPKQSIDVFTHDRERPFQKVVYSLPLDQSRSYQCSLTHGPHIVLFNNDKVIIGKVDEVKQWQEIASFQNNGKIDSHSSCFSTDGKFIFIREKTPEVNKNWTVLRNDSTKGWQWEPGDLFKNKQIFFSGENGNELIAVPEPQSDDPATVIIYSLDDDKQWQPTDTIPRILPEGASVLKCVKNNNQITFALDVPVVLDEDYDSDRFDPAEHPAALSVLTVRKDDEGQWSQSDRINIPGNPEPLEHSPDGVVRVSTKNCWDGHEATTAVNLFDLSTQTQQAITFPDNLRVSSFCHPSDHPRSIGIHMHDSVAKSDVVDIYRQDCSGEWNLTGKITPDDHHFKALSFNHDGSLLVTLSSNKIARVWGEVSEGHLEEKGRFRVFDDSVDIRFSPDGRYILVGSTGLSNVWEVLPDEEYAYVSAEEDEVSSDEASSDEEYFMAENRELMSVDLQSDPTA